MRAVILTLIAAMAFTQGKPADTYTVDRNTGKSYKIMYEAKNWARAKNICKREGAKLAVPKSKSEFDFIQKLIRGMQYADITGTEDKFLVFVGINNLENYKKWRNVDGENIEHTGFHKWARKDKYSHSNDPKEPHCVGMDAANPGLRSWWCHRPQPYVCEKSA